MLFRQTPYPRVDGDDPAARKLSLGGQHQRVPRLGFLRPGWVSTLFYGNGEVDDGRTWVVGRELILSKRSMILGVLVVLFFGGAVGCKRQPTAFSKKQPTQSAATPGLTDIPPWPKGEM